MGAETSTRRGASQIFKEGAGAGARRGLRRAFHCGGESSSTPRQANSIAFTSGSEQHWSSAALTPDREKTRLKAAGRSLGKGTAPRPPVLLVPNLLDAGRRENLRVVRKLEPVHRFHPC
jgi:hypothetical protein